MGKYSLAIVLLFITLSCSNRKKTLDAENVIHIEKSDFKDWTSLIHLEDVISLSENEDSLLTIANKCLVSDKRILFWDYKMKCVYVYNRQGKFLSTIGRRGGADFECVDLRDIIFSGKRDERIELLDATGILVYDADNCNFIKKNNLGIPDMAMFHKFIHLQNDDYLFFSDTGEHSIYAWNGTELRGLRKREGYQLITNRFYACGTTCLVMPDYGKFVIDEFADGLLVPKYYLDFDSEELPKDDLPITAKQFEKIDGMEDYFKSIVDVKENAKWLYAKVVGPSRIYYDIYNNKKSGELWAGPADMKLGLSIVAIEGNSFWGIIYPEYISEESSFRSLVQKYIDEERLNPILVKFGMYKEILIKH